MARISESKVIKTMFKIDVLSVIEGKTQNKKGEASTGYSYMLDAGFPELAYCIASFLKEADKDPDIKAAMKDDKSPGAGFINLLQQYYKLPPETK